MIKSFVRTLFAMASILFAVNAIIRFADGCIAGAALCSLAALGLLFSALTYRSRWSAR